MIVTAQKVFAIYFSPTGTTKSVIKHILTEFDAPQETTDLTPYEKRDIVKLLKGNGTPVVLVATYGNIHYSNALFELQQIAAANGFITIAAAVVVSEHNVVNEIDLEDLAQKICQPFHPLPSRYKQNYHS